MGTLIAYASDTYKYLGYAIGGEFNGLYAGVKESPLIISNGNLIIGILNNRYLQQYLTINGHKPVDLSYISILNSFDFIRGYEKYQHAEVLMITADSNIFYWKDGLLYDIKGRYFAIGDGREIAMGCMYGLRSSTYEDQDRIEITLKAIAYNRPNQAMSTGLERI